jgi:hypothetical protein
MNKGMNAMQKERFKHFARTATGTPVTVLVCAAALLGSMSCTGPNLPPIDEAAVQARHDAVAAFEPEMLVHWTFDSPCRFGAIEPDRSGNSVDGRTIWNGQRSAGGVTWRPDEGLIGGAGFVPGHSRGCMHAAVPLELPESWTVSLWYKPLAGKPDGQGDYSIVYLDSAETGKTRFGLGQRGGWSVQIMNPQGEQIAGAGLREPKRKAGEWHHLAVVVNAQELRFYVNGTESKAAATLPESMGEALRLGIAGRKGAPHHKAGGHYDELRIYGRDLSQEEILALADKDNAVYDTPVPPVADAGVGYTAHLEDGSSSFTMQGCVAGGDEGVEYLWEVIEQPEGAKARFADPLDPQTTFHTDTAGDYLFELSAQGRGGVDRARVKGVVFAPAKVPANPTLYDIGDGRALATFGYEPQHPQRAERLRGQSLPLIQHWTLDNEEAGSVPGRHGKAVDLRQLPNRTLELGRFPALTEEFSLSFWVFNSEQLHGGNLVRGLGDDGKEYWKAWYRHNKSKVGTDSILYYKWYQGTGMVPTGDWAHIVLTYSENGTLRKLYINGQQAAWEREGLGDATGDPRLVFNVPCLLDDVALYGTTLNSEEVLALYRSESNAATVTERIPADPYQTLAYTQEQMDRYFQDPEPEVVKEGFAAERFGVERLDPYVHPRLNFTLEDLPRIRRMARESEAGHNNHAFVTLYPAAAFGWEQERYSPNASRVEKDGKKTISVDTGQGASSRISLAYKALLEADTWLARLLIDGMMESAKLQREMLDERLKVSNDWQGSYHDLVGRRVTPQMYDYLYNWMTDKERSVIRGILADATAGKCGLGMYGVPAHNAHISNWQPWITGEMFIALESIYGEEGFDPRAHQAAGRALALTASNMNGPEDGAHFEGMGKSNIGASQLSVLARTQPVDEKVVASSAMFNHLTRFRFHAGLPWDHSRFMTDEKLGGLKDTGGPALNVMHYAYPDNPILNYLKRLQNEDATTWSEWNLRAFGQESWLYTATYVQDWQGPADPVEHLAQAAGNEPLGYMSHFRGQMISRDRWHPDAVQLMFMPRVICGGHWQPCRGYFRVNALGREWFTFRSFASHEKAGEIPARNSIVTVDGDGQDVTTARLLHYEGAAENSDAVFDICTADLTGSYRHSGDAWATMNATRLKPDKRAWFDAPKGLLPHSLNAFQPKRSGPMTVDGIDLAAVPLGQRSFEYAYRTAVFARGEHPYILILDDFRKDDEVREYTWNAALPKDLMDAQQHAMEGARVVIHDPRDSDNRLLVQMLHEGEGAFALEPAYSRHDKKNTDLINLCFKSRAAGQRFRALIYPHRKGAPVPKVEARKAGYIITIGDQVDGLVVSRDAKGRQQVRMRRK